MYLYGIAPKSCFTANHERIRCSFNLFLFINVSFQNYLIKKFSIWKNYSKLLPKIEFNDAVDDKRQF